MISQYIKGKVYVFIDAANIFYAQRTLKWKVSYEKLKKYFQRECDVGKMFVYIGTDPHNPKQKKCLDMLEINGYIVRTKQIKQIRIAKGVYQWKSNFDVELALDMMDGLSEYDTAVLLSGDSDFALVIIRVKSHGKRVIVMSAKYHVSRELLERAKYVNLKKVRDEIELK